MASRRVRRPPLVKWLREPLQGITYWIGHRRALYSGYALGESALVAEMCNMIYTHLDSDLTLKCEVQYTKLLGGTATTDILSARARADIVISRKINGSRQDVTPEWVIEVKRASASNAQINKDLQRLAAAKRQHPALSAFLIVIAEAERPNRFVDPEGMAIISKYRIPETDQLYRVRRVCKATHTFRNPDRASYACAVEVSVPQMPGILRRHTEWTA